MSDYLTVDGVAYAVEQRISPTRAIVSYQGAAVFVDLVGDAWVLSGEPARPGIEQADIKEDIAPMLDVSVVTETKGP